MATRANCPIYFNALSKFVLKEDVQRENGFPVVENGVVFLKPNQYQLGKQMYYQPGDCARQCLRCKYTFFVDKSGHQTVQSQDVCHSSNGSYKYHIHDQKPVEDLLKFQRTHRASINAGNMFALDVEMVYTTMGQEVGRVTLVDHLGHPLLDSMVLPENPVIDYVTEFSGLTEQSFIGVETTLEDITGRLLSFIDERSVLVGHGLNGDLKALRMIHSNVVDTSILLQPKGGKRPSLRSLCSTHLNMTIQQNPNGHCSEEDAVAALELVHHCVVAMLKRSTLMAQQVHLRAQQLHYQLQQSLCQQQQFFHQAYF